MSGETETNESGWTTDTLHAHVTMLFEGVWREMTLLRDRMAHDFGLQAERMDRQWKEQERRTQIALDAHEEALRVARETSQRETATSAQNQKEAINAALSAQKEAAAVLAETLAQYRETQNEWRGSLNDVSIRAMPRSEAEAAIQRATERIQEIVLAQTSLATRSEVEAAVRSVRAESDAQKAAVETARQADRDRITELTNRVTQMSALSAGAADKVKGIYAALGIAVTLIIAAIAVFNFVSAR